ncbi:hypothetical protein CNR22_24250 [Sphingobacteriaceae bacterium]|nr:hypothetical protein CNR22_24250 [Sphingobacteriaceae bacterium]
MNKKNNMKKILPFIIAISCVWACQKDFVVSNISKKSLKINAPSDNASTTINLVTFWWDVLDGAEQYNLQIVKPDFTNTVQLLVDTNVITNKFNFALKPGTYQWRVKATNAGYSTPYQTFNLKIDTTSDLSEQVINLVSPAKGAIVGNTAVTFNWSSISVAKKYRLQINEGLILDTTLVSKTSLSYNLPAAKSNTTAYTWNVKAINDFSESQFNPVSFTVTVDLKGPTTPVLQFPAINGTMKTSDSLKWNANVDILYDSVYVADDSLFSNVFQVRTDINYIPVSDLSLSPNALGTFYWWKVRAFDKFGNPSGYTSKRKFSLTQ